MNHSIPFVALCAYALCYTPLLTQAHEEGHEHDHTCEHDHAHEHSHEHSHEHTHDHDHECSHEHHEHHHHTHTEQPGGILGTVTLTPQAQRSLAMSLEPVPAAGELHRTSLFGRLGLSPLAAHTYALPVAGQITLKVRPAQVVKQGEPLYTLNSPAVAELFGNAAQAAAALQRANTELETLKARVAKLQQIGTRNQALETELAFKQAELPGLQAAAQTAQNQLSSLLQTGTWNGQQYTVRARQAGQVQAITMNQGAWGEQGATVLEVADPARLEFTARFYGAEPIDALQGRLILPNSPAGVSGTLRVEQVPNRVTQARTVYFTPAALPAGTYAGQQARLDLFVPSAAADGYIAIPNSALVKIGVNDAVFLKIKDNTYVAQQVSCLSARHGKTPVKGLIPGQTMVTKGGYELKYALPATGDNKPKAAGHFHADGQFHEGEH